MVIALQVSSQPPGVSTPGGCTPNPSGNLRLIHACLKVPPDFEHILTINNTNPSQDFSGRDKWSVNATDKESHIIKQIGTDFKNPLTGWTNWNNSTDKTMHWANSVNHDRSADLFPKYSDNLADAITSHVAYSDISNAFPSSVYAHESTRPKSLFNTPNALPSAVIAGHYLIDGTTATFYKYGDQIFSTDEYWEAIARAQEALFNLDGSKPDANDLKGILTDITPSKEIAEEDIANNLVTPQITTISNIIAFYDADNASSG